MLAAEPLQRASLNKLEDPTLMAPFAAAANNTSVSDLTTCTAFEDMSGVDFEKTSHIDISEVDATRLFSDASALSAYGQRPYGNPLFANSFESTLTEDTRMPSYLTAYNNDSQLDLSPSPVPEPAEMPSNLAAEVLSYGPSSGSEGTKIDVCIQMPFDVFTNPSTNYFSLLVGSETVECSVSMLGFQDSAFKYLLSAEAPSFNSTNSPSSTTSLRLMIAGYDCHGSTVVPVGSFTYDHSSDASAASAERKRRISDASDDTRSATLLGGTINKHQRLHSTPSFSYSSESLSGSPYSVYLPTPASSVFPHHYQTTAPASPASLSRQYNGVQRPSYAAMKAHSHLSSTWNPSFCDPKIPPPSPAMDPNGAHHSMGPSAVHGKPMAHNPNPTLIRTSTIQQSLAGVAMNQHGSFSPYMMYPSKAVLKLNGDLDGMARNWSREETECKRRLVQFTRKQNGSTIYADFAPVTLAERQPNGICISCIFWDGKKECYVTSVDTIYLLEYLVGVRFTVEEKNRIRRNLEGFRPLTVSKSKPDSEDFFKVIMGFPNPKPRNIEKDVKVFPWKILAHALKKIIGKYSASYTCPVSNSNNNNNNNLSAGGYDMAAAARSQSPATHGVYNHFPNMSTSRLSSSTHARASSATSLASMASFDSCSPMHTPRHQYLSAPDAQFPHRPYSFSYPPPPPGSAPAVNAGMNTGMGIGVPAPLQQQQHQQMLAPHNRLSDSWDMASYVNTAPATPGDFVAGSDSPFGMPSGGNEL